MNLSTIVPVLVMVAGALLTFGPGLLRFLKKKGPALPLPPVANEPDPMPLDDHHMALELFSCLYQVRSVLHSQGYSEAVQVIDSQLIPSVMQAVQDEADGVAHE